MLSSIVFYLAALIIWRMLNPNLVLFYQGVLLAFIVSIVQYIVQSRSRNGSDSLKNAFITFLVCYCFMFTVPTTADRSYSVSLILELNKHPEGQSRQDIEQFFTKDFVSRGGVQKRLHEQLATGTIKEQGDLYELTTFGHFLAQSFRWIRRLFSVPEIQV